MNRKSFFLLFCRSAAFLCRLSKRGGNALLLPPSPLPRPYQFFLPPISLSRYCAKTTFSARLYSSAAPIPFPPLHFVNYPHMSPPPPFPPSLPFTLAIHFPGQSHFPFSEMLIPLLLLLVLAWVQPAKTQLGQRTSSIFERVKEPTCRPMDIPLCRDIPYNRTIFPNPFVELDLASLQAQTEHFKPLIRTRCSTHILFFICSVFAPMCPEQMPQAVTSCRSVCEEVQRDCIKIFQDFDFPWPPALNCSRFPSLPALCMRPEANNNNGPVVMAHLPPSPKAPECPQDLVDLDPNDPMGKCAFRCEKTTMFRKDRKEQARIWLCCWSLLNSLVSLFTISSFWIDRQRFSFPERSVCFLALCSLLSSLPHILRPLLGFDTMACAKIASGAKYLILEGPQENSACLASFLLAYYFSLAGSFWWLILSFTWFLSASRKWVEEEIGKRSVLLHLLAWGFPALMAAGTFVGHWVDSSELTGICSTGNSDPLALLYLWLLPRLFLTILGLFLLLSGFSSMSKERHSFRRRGTDTSRLEKFLLKMGSFAAVYVLSSFLSSLADFHHLSILAHWNPNTIGCKARGGIFSGHCVRPEQPEPEIYVLGQTMALAVGLATGLWIFSPKTLTSWKRALFCCWPAAPKREMAQLQMGPMGSPLAPALSAHSRPASLPPSQHPLLSSFPADPALLPPPPPTAVPSSTYNPFFAPNYIPLSILANDCSGGTKSGRKI